MDGVLACPGCRRKLRLHADCAGKLVQCPACLTQFCVPLAEGDAPPVSSVPQASLPGGAFTPVVETGRPLARPVPRPPGRRSPRAWKTDREDASLPGQWGKGNNLLWGLALAGL